MRGDPEAGQTRGPDQDENAERIVPRVDRREIEDGKADPEARVAVAPGLEVEARDRDEQDGEVGLGHHAPEQGADRVREKVGKGRDHERGDEDLAPEGSLPIPAPKADHVAGDRDTKPERGDDVVLAVKHYRQDRNSKCREDNDSPFE